MKRFLLLPHVGGWGHRVRCDTLGCDLLSSAQEIMVTIGLRADDPMLGGGWTILPMVSSTFARSWSILRAAVLVEDGLGLSDVRVRLMKRFGGKLVLIVQPTGFGSGREIRRALELADLIIVPFPKGVLQLDAVLEEFIDKVRHIPPILNVARVVRNPSPDRFVVYFEMARPPAGLDQVISDARDVLETRIGRPVIVEGTLGQFRPYSEHVRLLAEAGVVVAQGTTAAFEAICLGIPLVIIPIEVSREQTAAAESLVQQGVAQSLKVSEMNGGLLAQTITEALANPPVRPLDFVESGLEQAKSLLTSLAGLTARKDGGPPVSIISTNYNCGHALQDHLTSIYSQFPENDFEYVLVDNYSTDTSPRILARWASDHSNFFWIQKRSTMGRGREIAATMSHSPFLLVVDTDTVYLPILRTFVSRAIQGWPKHAVQAIYAGVFPRFLWRVAGGRSNLNTGEDFEMWMRLWRLGRIRWYPVKMGTNIKEAWARDSEDYLSHRYRRRERIWRMIRSEFDHLHLRKYERLELSKIWKSNSIDLGQGPLESSWFGEDPPATLFHRLRHDAKATIEILRY